MMNADINSVAIASSSTPLDLALLPYELRMVQTATTFNNSISASKRRHNPRKKRSRNKNDSAVAVAVVRSKAKYSKNPDPSARKITPQCTECGKTFCSDKALFGHMRCHPERQWRGINPPPIFRRPISVSPSSPIADLEESPIITEEDQDIADCLLMLASGPSFIDRVSDCRFECSSCKKVFGSHQALGGHRASHKNVKGCFAIAKSDEETEEDSLFRDCGHPMILGIGHKCSICTRVFASGPALVGHKRCHWEGMEENAIVKLDLNMPAPVEDGSSSSYSSDLTLDLRSLILILLSIL